MRRISSINMQTHRLHIHTHMHCCHSYSHPLTSLLDQDLFSRFGLDDWHQKIFVWSALTSSCITCTALKLLLLGKRGDRKIIFLRSAHLSIKWQKLICTLWSKTCHPSEHAQCSKPKKWRGKKTNQQPCSLCYFSLVSKLIYAVDDCCWFI